MASVAEIKQQYPDLEGLDDNGVVDALHQAFYSTMPREEVAKALGIKPAPEPAKPRTLGGNLKDAGIALLKGAIAVPEAAVGVADLATGGRAGKLAEEAGFRPKEAKAILDENLSDPQKQANKNVAAAEGLGNTFMAAVQNPSVVAQSVVESLPLMAAGGVVARGGMALAPRLGAVAAGAAGEGAVGAGSAAEQIRQQTGDGLLTGTQAALAGATGVATTGFAMLGGKIAQKLGIADIDTMMAGAAKNPVVAKGVVRSALEGAVAEGFLEELPQSVSEQVLQNIALNKPLEEGVNQAAVLGLLAGGVMGGGANVVNSLSGQPEPVVQPAPIIVDPKGPMARAANVSTPLAAAGLPVEGEAAAVEPEPLADPVMARIQAIEDPTARSEALAAYNIQNREDAPKGVKAFNKTLLNDILRDKSGPMLIGSITGKTGADLLDEQETDPLLEAARQSEEKKASKSSAGQSIPASDATNSGAEELGPRGQFKTAQEAQDFISTQRRGASINLPPALPVEFEDGSHGVAVQGTPNYDEAHRQSNARRLVAAGVLEGDLLNPKGEPFKTKMAAGRVQKTDGGEVVPVTGGFVVRPGAKSVENKPAGEAAKGIEATPGQAAEAGATGKGGKPAAGDAAGSSGVEAAGVKTVVNAAEESDLDPNSFAGSIKLEMEKRAKQTDQKKGKASRQKEIGQPTPTADKKDAPYRAVAKGEKFILENADQEVVGAAGGAGERLFKSADDAHQWAKANGLDVDETEDAVTGDLLKRASAAYQAQLDALPAEVDGEEAGLAQRRAQAAEQVANPQRFHKVEEVKNPKGLVIGDRVVVSDKKFGDSIGTVVSVALAPPAYKSGYMVNVAADDSYGGWSDLGDVEVVQDGDEKSKAAAKTPAKKTAKVEVKNEPKDTRLGRDNVALSEGGKPYKTKASADRAKKLQPMMRVVKAEGGYVLAEKTPAQLAAQEKAARRMATPKTSPAGQPIPAHAMIAAAGGLAPAERADMGMEGNTRIGNRYLFAGEGKGLTMERATEKLIEDGFLPENATHEQARALIKRSLTQPQYTAEGFERLAEAEATTRFEDYLAAQQDAAQNDDFDPFETVAGLGYTPDDAENAGYNAADSAIQLEVNALLLQAEAIGIDTDEIKGKAHEDTLEGTTEDYLAASRAALQSAIEASAGNRSEDAGQQGNQDSEEGLTAPTAAEIVEKQERADAAEKEQAAADKAADATAKKEREQREINDKGRQDASAENFTLGQSAEDSLAGQNSLFDAPAEKAANPDELRAKADLQNALADLGDLLGAKFKANMVPEQEQKLLPVLTRLMDAAFRLGYIKFKDAAKYALDQIRAALGGDVADAITIDHLQGAYITMASGKMGVDTKRAVIDVEDKADIEAHTATAAAAEPAEVQSGVVQKYPSIEGLEIHLIKNNAGYAVNMYDTDVGEYLPSLRMYKGDDALEKATAYAEDIQKKADPKPKEKSDAPDTNGSVERNSQKPATEPAVVTTVQDDGRAVAGGSEDAGGRAGREDGGGQPDGAGVQAGGPLAAGERSDQLLRGGKQPSQSSLFDSGDQFGERSADIGITGIPPDNIPAKDVAKTAERSPDSRKPSAAEELKAAEATPVKLADLDNIRATLPQLLPGQQEDVLFAEKRFSDPKGYGVLFTNGTGTGKTFTGLGVVKRFAMQGKGNTLIAVPDEKIAGDWIEAGKLLGLDITQLADTKDAGKGVVITTYANLGQNDELAKREWDLVIPDEAHSLMQASTGEPTSYLHNLRAITYHPDGVSTRHTMLNREDIDRATALGQKIRDNTRTQFEPGTAESERARLSEESKKLDNELVALNRKLVAAREAVKAEVEAKQGAARTRLVGLSATPFAYEKTVDWANGYLFDYKAGYPHTETSLGYNEPDPRQYFFMTRFGYTMRYNKLTEPDGSKVDRGLLQRQFNGELKKTGALSGRMLDVGPDYDRRFVLVDSAIGNQIDDALNWVSEQARNSEKGDSSYFDLRKILDDQFDYLSRRYLLEAIKAHEVIPIVKAHMARGRKVVVFHDYKKGGGFNPFDIPPRTAGDHADEQAKKKIQGVNDAIAAFNDKFASLVRYPFGKFTSPIEVFKKELPQTMLVNGDEKRPDLLKRYKAFQDDGTGPQVMLVQSAKNKGWSGHDTTGKHQRVLINLGQPTAPTLAIQQEGRIYRTGQASDAIMRYLNTGTNWEKWAFATTIASRASTAENLGMGELSRALKDSFIASFEQSDAYPPGHEGEGKGGKEQDKASNEAVSEYDRAKTHYWATGKKTSKTKAQEGTDYFATPEPVGLKMVQWLDARSGEDTLEPSAGHGAIARWLPETTNRTVIEPSMALRSRLAMVMDPGKDRIIETNFEDLAAVNKYTGIVMNPPFGSGGKTAIDHLDKAAGHLRNGGRIVALIPTGPAADAKFDKWMNEAIERPSRPLARHKTLGEMHKGDTLVINAFGQERRLKLEKIVKSGGAHYAQAQGGEFSSAVNMTAVTAVEPGPRVATEVGGKNMYMVADIKLPQVTFERAGTSVATRIVVLEKQTNDGLKPAYGRKVDLSGIDKINDLFDRLEDMSMPHRVDVAAVEAPAAPVKEAVKPAPPMAVQPAELGNKVALGDVSYPVTTYTTQKGKELRGVWVESKAKALSFGPSTFEKRGLGFFVRERDFPKVAAGGQAAPAEDIPAFSRSAPTALKPVQTPGGTAFQGRDIVLGNPLKNVRQPGGDVVRVDYDLRDPVLFAQARDAGKTPSQAREAAHVGLLTVDIDKAGTIKSLRNIEIFQTRRGTGMAEKAVGAIMASLPENAKLHIHDILPTAVGFWDKMGAKFARSEDFMEAFLTPQQFKDSYEQRATAEGPQGTESEPGATPFSRSEQGGRSDDGSGIPAKPQASIASEVKRTAIQAAVKELTKNWANAPDIVVASSMLDDVIPKRVRDYNSQQSLNDTGAPEGFFYGGKAYLLADQITTADVPRVLFHEVLGHAGLRGVFGDALKPILMQLSVMRRGEVAAKAKDYGLNMAKEADRLMAAEEVLAEYAQTNPQLGYVKRAIAAIRTWLRANVPGFKDLELTDAEIINSYILPARGWVERGQQASTNGMVPAFSRGATDQTTTEAFKKWFGDSKVVDADGKPLVVYHGTHKNISEFDTYSHGALLGKGSYFTADPSEAGEYAKHGGGNLVPAFLALKNPLVVDSVLVKVPSQEKLIEQGHDGVLLQRKDGSVRWAVAFEPEQIKSAIGNNGDFDGSNPHIAFSRALAKVVTNTKDVKLPAGYLVGDFFNGAGKLNWWHRSVGTMYNLAQREPTFKRVYDGVQNFLNDVSYYATEAADLAPNILPKLDTWKDITKTPLSAEDNKAIAAPIFEGTLVWGRDEDGQPVKMEVLQAKADKLDAEAKARDMLRQDKIAPGVLKMWQGLPLDQYETLVNSRYQSEVLQAGIVFTPAELKTLFKLTDGQIKLYREFRDATDKSLTSLAISDMVRYGGKDVESIADAAMEAKTVEEASSMLRDYLMTLSDGNERKDLLIDMAGRMIEKSDKARKLMDKGYAPLSRFGTHSVDVVDVGGERVYFGLFESKAQATKMARRMAVEFPKAAITQGTTSEQSYKLFAGVSPETLELFGEMLGLEAQGDSASSKAFQEYLKLARSSRSAMKRLIQRKGIAGFSEDPGRVLAGFIYSNARQASGGLHMGEIAESVNDIPQGKGELKDAAIGLQNYIKNPQEEAQKFRGLLFAQYLGGSVASAMVNMTQPLTVTFPYLSQFGGIAKAAGQMRRAAADVMKKTTGDAELDAALKRAEEEGIVAPQEVHQLMAQANGSGSLKSGDGTKAGDAAAYAGNKLTQLGFVWGKLFSSAEQFNRRLTFIAAYRTAVAQNMPNPAKFAEKVIAETQFTYNKGSKPRWARGAIGGTLFTFKQYSVNYLELAHRMATQGGPEGKKAALLMVGVLMLMGGAGGLPFAEDAEDLVDAIMQRLGYSFSAKQKRNEFFQGLLGAEAARFLDTGISGLPGVPIDLSGRMGMGNLIPGTGLLVKKRDHTRDVVELAGPAGDLVSRGFQAANKLAGGNVPGAAESLLPVAGRNLIKAMDMANTGMYRDEKGRKVIDSDGYDAFVKAIGFQPNNVARVQDASSTAMNLIGQNKLRETEIADAWALGMFEGDKAKVDKARADLKDWNENNPSSKIAIQMPQIIKRVRAMRTSKEDRIAATAPKEIKASVKKELQRTD